MFLVDTGVYIMSKSSGIMKIDSPGKIGPGLANIDQDVIRKQILAAKQVDVHTNCIYTHVLFTTHETNANEVRYFEGLRNEGLLSEE